MGEAGSATLGNATPRARSARAGIRSGSDRGQFEGEPHGATLRSLLAEAVLARQAQHACVLS